MDINFKANEAAQQPIVDTASGTDLSLQIDEDIAKNIAEQISIVCMAIQHTLFLWQRQSPPPSGQTITYPLNFTNEEKETLRTFAKKNLKQYMELAGEGIKLAEINKAVVDLLGTWLIKKCKYNAITEKVLEEARYNYAKYEADKQQRSRFRSQSTASSTHSLAALFGLLDVAPEDPHFENESPEVVARRSLKNEQRKKRRYNVDEDIDIDEDYDNLAPPKAIRGSDSTHGRSRTQRQAIGSGGFTHYSSPSKTAEEISLASLEEDADKDGDMFLDKQSWQLPALCAHRYNPSSSSLFAKSTSLDSRNY